MEASASNRHARLRVKEVFLRLVERKMQAKLSCNAPPNNKQVCHTGHQARAKMRGQKPAILFFSPNLSEKTAHLCAVFLRSTCPKWENYETNPRPLIMSGPFDGNK